MELDSVEQYQELIEHASEIITLIDSNGIIQFQSPATTRLLGYETDELVDGRFFEYIHPDERERVHQRFEEFAASDDPVVEPAAYRFQHSDGSWVWLESITSNRPNSAIEGFVVNSRDVTEYKELEAELQRTANRLDAFSVAFPDLAFITDGDGLILDVIVGERSEDLLYEDQSEILDKAASDFLPENVAQEYTSAIGRAITTDQIQQLEYSLDLPLGERWFEARIESLPFQIDGKDVAIAVARDITARKADQEQLAALNEELEVLNRVIRHDIRNDMAIITGWAQLLEEYVNEEGQDALGKIQASGEHIIELTEIARDYVTALTGQGEVEKKPISIRSTLQTEIDLRREAYPGAIFLVEDDIPDVAVIANEMLSSVFRNLLNNAVQHNDRETPVVTISGDLQGESVVIAVADNGPGIPDDQKESIFGKGEKGLESTGTGIGLYLAWSLIAQCDGSIWVEDNEPTGAVFKVQLQQSG